MHSDLISIIIPVYNAEKYINQCLDSCFLQTFSNLEVIAVNDGSKDNSGFLLDTYSLRESRLKVIHKKNEGVTKTRIKALNEAKGEWIFFLDSDDYLPNYALEHLFNKAIQESADVVVGDFAYLDEEHSVLRIHTNTILERDIMRSALKFSLTCNVCGRLIKRKLLDVIEWPSSNIKIGEDIICGIQILEKSMSTVLLNEVIYNYVQYSNSTINSHDPIKVESMIPYY